MAASGYTPIILLNSTTTGNTPTTSNLAVGELAINVTDGKLFFNQSGTIKVLANATYATSVSTISFGTTGLTPSTATNGVVTVAGTLATTNGGTGLTSFTSGGVVYASSTSALATGSALVFDGSNLGLGVTPSNWASFKSVDVNTGGAGLTSSSQNCYLTTNAYFNAGWKYKFTTVYGVSWYEQFNGQHAWYSAPSGTAGNAITATQAMTLDTSGNLGVGSTTPSNTGVDTGVTRLFVVAPNSNTGPALTTVADSSGRNYRFADATKTYIGALDVTSGGVNIGSNSAIPLLFSTAATERARIDTSGNLLVGTTSQLASSKLTLVSGGNGVALSVANGAVGSYLTNTSGTGNWQPFSFCNNGTSFSQIGSITTTSVATLYNTTSDQRLKENIEDADSSSSLIDSLQVRKFDWKEDKSHQRYGFIAQELVTVAPEAVHQPTNEEDMMAVDYSKLVPMLVKEIQSLRKRILTLENK
jgi:hypothetical protein